MMHEVTEAFEGGRIAYKKGVGTPGAVIGGRNPVFDKAHRRATRQPIIIHQRINSINLRGNIRHEYSIEGKVFFTDPMW